MNPGEMRTLYLRSTLGRNYRGIILDHLRSYIEANHEILWEGTVSRKRKNSMHSFGLAVLLISIIRILLISIIHPIRDVHSTVS